MYYALCSTFDPYTSYISIYTQNITFFFFILTILFHITTNYPFFWQNNKSRFWNAWNPDIKNLTCYGQDNQGFYLLREFQPPLQHEAEAIFRCLFYKQDQKTNKCRPCYRCETYRGALMTSSFCHEFICVIGKFQKWY